jgi:hypothetical protein
MSNLLDLASVSSSQIQSTDKVQKRISSSEHTRLIQLLTVIALLLVPSDSCHQQTLQLRERPRFLPACMGVERFGREASRAFECNERMTTAVVEEHLRNALVVLAGGVQVNLCKSA